MNNGTAIISDGIGHKSKAKAKEGRGVVDLTLPYCVEISLKGTLPILFHRYDNEAVAAKGAARKGSKDKKTDNVESYVYRGADDELVLPGINLKAAIAASAKFSQDPRSPRKSAHDLYRAGIRVAGDLGFGVKAWDYLDSRRVQVQRNAITRVRPALAAGWKLSGRIDVLLPEYITADWLQETVERAGRLIGIGDFRPDFGTFSVSRFEAVAQG